MELFSPEFQALVTKWLESGVPVLGSLPAPRYGHTIPFVEAIKARGDTVVVKMTKASREGDRAEVERMVREVVEGGAEAGVGGAREASDAERGSPAKRRRRQRATGGRV